MRKTREQMDLNFRHYNLTVENFKYNPAGYAKAEMPSAHILAPE